MSKIMQGYKQTKVGIIPEDWEVVKLGEVLEYVRPDLYIVSNTDYHETGTPVLTANKSFILGYTQDSEGIYQDVPVIIFDDFTVDNKYVDFDFKVKSSAIKILKIKEKANLKFIYETMNQIRFVATEHKRYYISVYQNLAIPLPPLKEQEKIAQILSTWDKGISTLKALIAAKTELKKGLMQQLLTGKVRFAGFNDEWKEVKLGEVGKLSVGGDLSKLEYSKEKNQKYIYPIYANGAGKGLYGYATTYQYKPDCVTVSGRGSLGYANAREESFNAIVRLIVIEPKDDINACFLKEVINNIEFAIESTGVPQLTVPQVSLYKALFPTLPEQQCIAEVLSLADKEIDLLKKELDELVQQKKGIMQKLLTGQVRVKAR